VGSKGGANQDVNTTISKDVDSRDGLFLNWQLLAVFYLALAVSLMYIPGDL
jgi:hypothetical protein